MEVGSFFVPEERVRNPDLVPAVLAQPHVRYLIVDSIEDESRVAPLLPQIHTDCVILKMQTTKSVRR